MEVKILIEHELKKAKLKKQKDLITVLEAARKAIEDAEVYKARAEGLKWSMVEMAAENQIKKELESHGLIWNETVREEPQG